MFLRELKETTAGSGRAGQEGAGQASLGCIHRGTGLCAAPPERLPSGSVFILMSMKICSIMAFGRNFFAFLFNSFYLWRKYCMVISGSAWCQKLSGRVRTRALSLLVRHIETRGKMWPRLELPR